MAKRTARRSGSVTKSRDAGTHSGGPHSEAYGIPSARSAGLCAPGKAGLFWLDGSRFQARTLRAVALPPATGLLVAEGDSWFDYPFNDVLSMLEDEHGFDVESVAHKGDTVEDMAYSGGQFDDFARLLEKLLRQGRSAGRDSAFRRRERHRG